MVKHAFWWYFTLSWDKFQIIASVLVIWNISPAGTRVAPSESRSTHQLLLTFGSDRLLLITSSQPCIWIFKTWRSLYSLSRRSLVDASPHPIASRWYTTHILMLLLDMDWIFRYVGYVVGYGYLVAKFFPLVTPILYKCSDIVWWFSPHKCWVLVLVLMNEDFFINIRVDVVSDADVWSPSPTHCWWRLVHVLATPLPCRLSPWLHKGNSQNQKHIWKYHTSTQRPHILSERE